MRISAQLLICVFSQDLGGRISNHSKIPPLWNWISLFNNYYYYYYTTGTAYVRSKNFATGRADNSHSYDILANLAIILVTNV